MRSRRGDARGSRQDADVAPASLDQSHSFLADVVPGQQLNHNSESRPRQEQTCTIDCWIIDVRDRRYDEHDSILYRPDRLLLTFNDLKHV